MPGGDRTDPDPLVQVSSSSSPPLLPVWRNSRIRSDEGDLFACWESVKNPTNRDRSFPSNRILRIRLTRLQFESGKTPTYQPRPTRPTRPTFVQQGRVRLWLCLLFGGGTRTGERTSVTVSSISKMKIVAGRGRSLEMSNPTPNISSTLDPHHSWPFPWLDVYLEPLCSPRISCTV